MLAFDSCIAGLFADISWDLTNSSLESWQVPWDSPCQQDPLYNPAPVGSSVGSWSLWGCCIVYSCFVMCASIL